MSTATAANTYCSLCLKDVCEHTAQALMALRAELAASESLVTALQEQMARLAEQHAKAVAEAREEQREAAKRAHRDLVRLKSLTREGWTDEEVDAAIDATGDSTALRTEIDRLQAECDDYFNGTHDAFCAGDCGRLTANGFCRDCMVHGGVNAFDRLELAEGFLAEVTAERDHHAHVSALKSQRALEHVATMAKQDAALAAEVERHQATAKERDEARRVLKIWASGETARADIWEVTRSALGVVASLPAGPWEVR